MTKRLYDFFEEKPKIIYVSFRELEKEEVPSTTYASHGMYYYPAKFIPQVVRHTIKRYTRVGDVVFDPFAGSGTVGVEAVLTCRNSIVWDLNPIIEPLMEAKLLRVSPYDLEEVEKEAENIIQYDERAYTPKWSKINYWYHSEILKVLKKWWGYLHYKCISELKPLLRLALLKVTREFSYGDDQVPKLFKSKRKIKSINDLMKSDWKSLMEKKLREYVKDIFEKALEFTRYANKAKCNVYCNVKGGIDILNSSVKLEDDVQLLLTSPPYLIAHEYIRSTKLELFWLGYNERNIRNLMNSEIPYNKPLRTKIKSPTFKEYREKISRVRPDLLAYYDNYFHSIISAFEKFTPNIKGYIAIFVGNASLGGIEVPIHKVIREHFENYGFKYEITYIDKIKARRIFRNRKNPRPEGISHEYLVVLRNKEF